MTMDHEDFIEAILAAPDDDAPRLVYADWLLERDDPRGEFIRLQCELQTIADGDSKVALRLKKRENALLKENREKWTAGLRGEIKGNQIYKYEFRRGFIESVHAPAAIFADETRAAALFAAAPAISDLVVDCHDQSVRSVVMSPYAARLRSLQINSDYNKGFDDACAAICADSPHLSGLTRLQVARGKMTHHGARRLAESPHLTRLEELQVWDQTIGAEGIMALVESPRFQLTKLYCGGNNLGVEGAEALAASPRAARLTALDVSESNIGVPGLEHLARSPHLTRLTELMIRKNKLGWKGAEVVARAANFESVQALDLMANAIGPRGAKALAGTEHLAGVQELSLWQTGLGDEGAKILATAPLLGRLHTLNLRSNRLTDEGVVALAASPHFASIRSVNLNNNSIGRKGEKALDELPHLARRRIFFARPRK